MRLADKLKHLRLVEGLVRGKERALTQAEVARLMKEELGKAISQAYLSQLESGAREHMTVGTRALLAQFFKVHPGYLIGDPDEYEEELRTRPLLAANGGGATPAGKPGTDGAGGSGPPRSVEAVALSRWLTGAAQHPEIGAEAQAALMKLAGAEDPGAYLRLLVKLMDLPQVARDLLEGLKD